MILIQMYEKLVILKLLNTLLELDLVSILGYLFILWH